MIEAAAEVVRASRFELVDSEGHVRAALTLDGDGNPGLSFSDAQGNVRASLVLGQEGIPCLNLMGKAGTVRASLGFGSDWRVQLVLSDANSQVIWSAP
jgi:hypothetical protein